MQNRPPGCDFTQFIRDVYTMRDLTVQIVDAYFFCAAADCSSAVLAAYGKYVDFRNNVFNPYSVCSVANLSPQCAQVIQEVRSPVFASAENIDAAMLTCAKLKSQQPGGIVLVTRNFL